MGKRSDFKRIARDAYDTPREAVVPLLPHLAPGSIFVEPCAGSGELVRHLQDAGHCCWESFDIEPRFCTVRERDALAVTGNCGGDVFITNPPWDRRVLHPLISTLSRHAPTWLLFDADWAHTMQAIPYLPLLRKIVAVGRVKWIPDSKFTGKDNCCWFLFDAATSGPIEFVGRVGR